MNGADVLWGLSRVQVDENDFGQFSFSLFIFVVVGFGQGLFLAQEGVNACNQGVKKVVENGDFGHVENEVGPGIGITHIIKQPLNHVLKQVIRADNLGTLLFILEQAIQLIKVKRLKGQLTGIKGGIIDINLIIGFELLDGLGLDVESVHEVLDEV